MITSCLQIRLLINIAGFRRKALLCGPHFCVSRLTGMCNFAVAMFIKPTKKWRNPEGDSSIMVPYTYYRLCESERDASGRPKQRTVLGLGELLEFPTEKERKELAELLTAMIKDGEYLLCDNQRMYGAALGFYGKWLDEKREAEERQDRLAEEARRRAEEAKEAKVCLKLKSLQPEMSRSVGAEHVCSQTLERLGLKQFLTGCGWPEHKARLAMLQIASRAIFTCSEYKTVKYLRENSALCEVYGMDASKITKDTLYKGALDLYGLHREIEDHLHRRVCDLFDIEDKILLFDLTNTYFEGRMEGSEICQFGLSKEKRHDCKIVGLGAVVNTDGLLCRTEIFEGNRQDVTTLKEVIGSLEDKSDGKRHLIVIDAGFSSADNLAWLRENGYDYITVMRSAGIVYEEDGEVRSVADNKGRAIRLQKVRVQGAKDTVLMVDSDAKALKEASMEAKLSRRYEEGLAKIKAGIEGKGTKKRDKVNQRLGRLAQKYPGFSKHYDIHFEYDGKDVATSMSWHRKSDTEAAPVKMHGKYFLQTSLDESDEENIWQFYNVIRTVEETFKTLKLDLDIRPVYHKTDKGAKAHLHLAILAYWVVSVTKHILRQEGITLRWSELLRIMSAQQRVTITAQQTNGRKLNIRRSTSPEGKLAEIQNALGIPPKPTCSIKFVWPQKLPVSDDPTCKPAT